MDASVLSQQDEEVLVHGGEYHSRPRNSMCQGSEAGRKGIFWKNGWNDSGGGGQVGLDHVGP